MEGIQQVLLLQGQQQPPVSWLAFHPSLPPSLKAALRQVGRVGKEVIGGGRGGREGGEGERGRGSKVGWRKRGKGGGREGGGWLSVGGVQVEVETLLGVAIMMGLLVFMLKKQSTTR